MESLFNFNFFFYYRIKPSKEMKAAMKVVNDSLNKYPSGLPRHLKNAANIIQQEWFKVSCEKKIKFF